MALIRYSNASESQKSKIVEKFHYKLGIFRSSANWQIIEHNRDLVKMICIAKKDRHVSVLSADSNGILTQVIQNAVYEVEIVWDTDGSCCDNTYTLINGSA